MRVEQIVRAWKDEGYRRGLTAEERSLLPESPAGLVEVPEDELDNVGGYDGTTITITIIPVTILTVEFSCMLTCGRTTFAAAVADTCPVGTAGCCNQ